MRAPPGVRFFCPGDAPNDDTVNEILAVANSNGSMQQILRIGPSTAGDARSQYDTLKMGPPPPVQGASPKVSAKPKAMRKPAAAVQSPKSKSSKQPKATHVKSKGKGSCSPKAKAKAKPMPKPVFRRPSRSVRWLWEPVFHVTWTGLDWFGWADEPLSGLERPCGLEGENNPVPAPVSFCDVDLQICGLLCC